MPATSKPSMAAAVPVPSVTTVLSMSIIVGRTEVFSTICSVAYSGFSPVCGLAMRKCGVQATPSLMMAP